MSMEIVPASDETVRTYLEDTQKHCAHCGGIAYVRLEDWNPLYRPVWAMPLYLCQKDYTDYLDIVRYKRKGYNVWDDWPYHYGIMGEKKYVP